MPTDRRRPRVAIVTTMPRVERVAVYDEMARLDEIDFRVFYLQTLASGRRWSHRVRFAHDAVVIDELRLRRQLYLNPGFLARYRGYPADLTIVTGTYAPALQLAMYLETARRRPWVLWSELARTRFSEQPIVGSERIRDALRAIATFPVRRFASEIWAVGSRARRDYQRRVGDRIPVRNLPYFSDIDRFVAAGEARRRAGPVRFLFCNSLIARKGFDALLGAVEILASEGLELVVDIAGAGPLAERIARLSPAARSRVTEHGFLELGDVPARYREADVLLYPSRHDGWGMGVIEGMAAAMPVIATRFTGAAIDLIDDGVSGVILDRVDAASIAAAMRRFIERPGDIEPIGDAAAAIARRFDHRAGARRFIDTIDAALGR